MVLLGIFDHISDANPATLFVTISSILALILHGLAIRHAKLESFLALEKPLRLQPSVVGKKCRFPVPIQLIVVVIGTALSYAFDLAGK